MVFKPTRFIVAGRCTSAPEFFGLPRLLNGRFPNHRTGRGPVLHKEATTPPRSPDLTPCNIVVRGADRDHVLSNQSGM